MFHFTPPLGWNTWNTFGMDFDEKVIMESADCMVNSGLKAAGYEYIVIDDMWQAPNRDKKGRLVPDPKKFPHGIKYIADYVHSQGLKLGIYSDAGYITCAGRPGSYDYEWIDAKTFAEWEVDLLKYDYCFHPTTVKPDVLYKRMALALSNSGRDILLSACSQGFDHTRQWVRETGSHMWRSTDDIFDCWESIKSIALSQIVAQEYNAPGCFNDMDMLVVGMNGTGFRGLKGCTFEEYKLHFSLWAMLNSPLMIGCDIRHMSEETKKILMNKEILAINQDPACRQAFFVSPRTYTPNEKRKSTEPFYEKYPLERPVLAKYLNNGDIAIGFFNFSDEEVEDWVMTSDMTITPDQLGLPIISGKTLVLTDLWTGEVVDAYNHALYQFATPPHSCRMFRAKVVDAQ